MKLEAIERQARRLSQRERASPVLALKEMEAASEPDITDEELEQGKIEGVLPEEFVRLVELRQGR